MSEVPLEEIRSSLDENLSMGEAKILEGIEGPRLVLVIPHRSESVRDRIARAARDRISLDFRIRTPIVQAENDWIYGHINHFIAHAVYRVRRGWYEGTETQISRSRDRLHIAIYNDIFRSTELARKVETEALLEREKLLKIAGTDTVSVSASGFPREALRPFIHCATETDDDDDHDANPNWPSKTGNPSGGGRGNNPPGTRR